MLAHGLILAHNDKTKKFKKLKERVDDKRKVQKLLHIFELLPFGCSVLNVEDVVIYNSTFNRLLPFKEVGSINRMLKKPKRKQG